MCLLSPSERYSTCVVGPTHVRYDCDVLTFIFSFVSLHTTVNRQNRSSTTRHRLSSPKPNEQQPASCSVHAVGCPKSVSLHITVRSHISVSVKYGLNPNESATGRRKRAPCGRQCMTGLARLCPAVSAGRSAGFWLMPMTMSVGLSTAFSGTHIAMFITCSTPPAGPTVNFHRKRSSASS